MVSKSVVQQAYKLGEIVFSVTNCNDNFVEELSRVLPFAKESLSKDDIYEARMGCITDLRDLVNHIFKRHKDCIWMRSACMVTPGGQTVLIAGATNTGKSTIAMCLAFGFGWKLVAEDVVLFNRSKNEILEFPAPFGVKPGTAALVNEITGVEPQPVVLKDWFSSLGWRLGHNISAHLDLAVNLESDAIGQEFRCSDLSISEFLRKNLTTSNVLRVQGGMDKFVHYGQQARFFSFSGGTMRERVGKILELSSCNLE